MRFLDTRARRQPVLEESRADAAQNDGTQLVQLIFAGLLIARWAVSWWRNRGEKKKE